MSVTMIPLLSKYSYISPSLHFHTRERGLHQIQPSPQKLKLKGSLQASEPRLELLSSRFNLLGRVYGLSKLHKAAREPSNTQQRACHDENTV